jgi:hypothetical protein
LIEFITDFIFFLSFSQPKKQVNVKYEDLPNFLKVAEALQVKGLHGEVSIDQFS